MTELRSQLKTLVGHNNDGSTLDASSSSGSPYPSMRTLPALGSRYADLYREAKIQEAVYAFVTQQLEMAKIQEAKELPIVRVMDAGVASEKRSSPVRSLIVAGSVFGALVLACLWVMGRHRWEQVPADDPYRLLASDVAGEVKLALRKLQGRRK
jgi:hypothetical protein